MEFELIGRIHARAGGGRADVHLGSGDDAALLAPPPGQELAVCTDTLVEGVHFAPATEPADIGWRALAVNLSDLAAMGATPAWALLALTLPAADPAWVDAFATGFGELAARHGIALVGGDTTRGALAVTVTALGFVPVGQALRRAGARAGDLVCVTGSLGDAAAGLRSLAADDPAAARLAALPAVQRKYLQARLLRPEPRLGAGTTLRGSASACIDVSDGLLADLGHIARASGVGIEINADALPASPALQAAFPATERSALQAAGGEDFELAFTVAAADAAAVLGVLAREGPGATPIGHVQEGSGVRLVDGQGRAVELPRQGWEHFT